MRFPLLAAWLGCVSAGPALADYSVFYDPAQNLPPVFRLDLPAEHGNALEARASAYGQSSQIVDVRCDGQPLAHDGMGRWRLPPQCRQVEWRVALKMPPPDGANVSLQQSLGFPGWVLLSSSTALLAEPGREAAATLRIRVPGQAESLAAIPAAGQAPEFYAIGKTQETVRQVAGLRVRYVADDLERVTRRGLLDLHAEALTALRRIFPPPAAHAPFADDLLVVMLGRNNASSAFGAGGLHGLLANYPRETAARDTFLLALLAHEQAHQLLALGEVKQGSTWMAEGLAHYYGLKVMRQSTLPEAEKEKVWRLFIKPEAPVAQGLIALQQRYRDGDQSVYPLFYSQGATFFAELDQALQSASQGKHSLDDFIPQLRTQADGSLPDALLAQLRETGGERVDALAARYLGKG
ncbi:hypothetical protein C2134_11440 [Chromobacterium sinusclupearum]|uniref:Peptidase M61 catalytic domain-containing protein n=1 Tax=Chromobacterium sinusclupearum TaxID=2077146 RepID=A0A2K4MN78_9NEIS|nr:hypothetical protein [Chromobacterium sinusclupearum]POA98510.1 hypothetical protein C2134_11440 [Chromobacterium sinusclupearum]